MTIRNPQTDLEVEVPRGISHSELSALLAELGFAEGSYEIHCSASELVLLLYANLPI